MRSERGKRAAGGRRITVRGVSFWQSAAGDQTTEVNTHDALDLDAHGARWAVTPLTGEETGPPIESLSPEVLGFLLRVVAEKERIARRRIRVPIPKPVRKPAAPRPPHAPVPCPMCRPDADANHPGEAWPDCEVCDGDGVVTARQAAAWHEEHD